MKKRGRKPKCPYCGSSQVRSKGVRSTITLGDRPLWFCKSCQRKFTAKRAARPKGGSKREEPSTPRTG